MESVWTAETIWAAVAALLGGGGIGTLTTYFISSRKQKHSEDMDLLPHLVARLQAVELAHNKCQEDHSKVQNELGRIQEAIRHQTDSQTMVANVDKLVSTAISKMETLEQYLHARMHDLLNALGPVPAVAATMKNMMEKVTSLEVAANTNQASVSELRGMLHAGPKVPVA